MHSMRDDASLHAAAEELLAQRLINEGRPAGDYTADEYLQAMNEVAQTGDVLAQSDLETVLAETGGETVVTNRLLHERQHEILASRGFRPEEGLERVSEGERLDAMRQAIAELGKPGEERKDLAIIRHQAVGPLVSAAYGQGLITERETGVLSKLTAENPDAVIARLEEAGFEVPGRERSAYRDPEFAKAARTIQSTEAPVGEDSVHAHLAAEKILRAAGKVNADGELDYSTDDYVQAAEAVRIAGVEATDELCVTARSWLGFQYITGHASDIVQARKETADAA